MNDLELLNIMSEDAPCVFAQVAQDSATFEIFCEIIRTFMPEDFNMVLMVEKQRMLPQINAQLSEIWGMDFYSLPPMVFWRTITRFEHGNKELVKQKIRTLHIFAELLRA